MPLSDRPMLVPSRISRSDVEGIRRATDTSSFSWHKIATKTPSPSGSYTVAGTEDIRDIFGLTETINLAE
jgi:hypothetical protein